MIRPLVRSILVLSAAAVASGACNDAVGPEDFAGTYRLVRFEGMELPAVISRSGTRTVSILGERIILGDDGKGISSVTMVSVDEVTGQPSQFGDLRTFEYEIRDGRLEIPFGCPINADCVGQLALRGERIANGLALAALVSSKPASIYERVR